MSYDLFLNITLVTSEIESMVFCKTNNQIIPISVISLLVEDEDIQRGDLTLQKKIMQLEESIKELISVKTDIERELQLKLDSLWIDGNQCPLIRHHYPSANQLSGYQ